MEDLKVIHKYCFENKKMLEKVDKCGCFYCLKIFVPKEIEEWIEDRNDDTAICPYCGIDSVIPISLNDEYILDEKLLQKMYEIWFEK